MAFIKSVEKFSISLPAATASASGTLTKSQDTDNCVPYTTYRVVSGGGLSRYYDKYACDVDFDTADEVTVSRTDSVNCAVWAEVTVVEYDDTKVTVQSGTFSISDGATTDNATLTTIVENSSYPYVNYHTTLANDHRRAASIRARIDATTTLGIYRPYVSDDVNGHWYLIESDDSDFTTEEVSFDTTGASASATIDTVDVDKTAVFSSGFPSNFTSDNSTETWRVRLSSPTQITTDRQGTAGTIWTAAYAVKFAGDEVVQRGSTTQTSADALEDIVLPSALTNLEANAMVFTSSSAYTSCSFPGTDDADIPDAFAAWSWVDADTIRVQHGVTGGEANNIINWEVIEWALDAPVGPTRRVMVIS
jgi:hypothetical protein